MAPLQGSWLKRDVHPVAGLGEMHLVKKFGYCDPSCPGYQDSLYYGGMNEEPDDPWDEMSDELVIICPIESNSSSSSSITF
jgi:hypothetical protein